MGFVKTFLPSYIIDILRQVREVFRDLNPILLTKFDKYFIAPRVFEDSKKKFNSINDAKIIILVCCKNNYLFFNEILLRYCQSNLASCAMVVVDDHSNIVDEIQREQFRQLNITFLTNSGRGFQFALTTLYDFLNQHGKRNKIIFQMSHDNYPIVEDPTTLLNENADKMISENIALIGLNTFDYRQTRREILQKSRNMKTRFGMLGRRTLHRGPGGWIRGDAVHEEDVDCRYFDIEAPVDMSVLLNLDLVMKYLEPSNEFWLFCWLDDISNTLLLHNEKIIVDSSFHVYHCQELKRKYKLPVNSVTASKQGDVRYHKYEGHLEAWNKKWRYDRGDKKTVETWLDAAKDTRLAEMIKRKGLLRKYQQNEK